MSKRELLIAPLQPDLQTQLLQSLETEGRGDVLAPRIVVAPTAALVEHLGRTQARRHASSLHLVAHTWWSLAAALTAPERRGEGRRILSLEAAAWHARTFLARERRPPGFFDRSLDVRGFRFAMQRTFDELGQAGLARARDVERFLVRHGSTIRPRVRHLLELYLGYRRGLEPAFDDGARMLARAGELSAGGARSLLGSDRIWVYAYEEMGALEIRLLASLAADPGLDLLVFAPTPGCVESGLCRQLEKIGFGPRTLRAASRPGAPVEVISAPGEESEAREITRRVLAAFDQGIPFWRMGVVAKTSKPLGLLVDTLRAAGVPCAPMSGEALATRRAGRALLHLLDLLEQGLVPGTALGLLAVAPLRWQEWCGIPNDPTPSSWERVAQEARLGRGLRDWKAKLQRLRERLEERVRERGEEGEPASRARAGARAASELLALATKLDAALRRFPRRGSWSDFVDVTRCFVEDAFTPDRDRVALLEALERLRALDRLRRSHIARADFRDIVRRVLTETRVHAVAAAMRRGGVRLGTAAEMHAIDFEVLCIMGMQEGDWPGPVSEDPVLRDRDRLTLGGALQDADALPLRRSWIARERRAFRNLVRAARRKLVISFARLDPGTGAARLPSMLLVELAEEREGRALDFAELDRLDWVERVPLRRSEPPAGGPLLSREEYDLLALARLGAPARRRYVRRLGGFAARGLLLDSLRNGRARFTVCDGWLATEESRARLALEFSARTWSASQLATYATCPFRFFMRQALRLEPLDRDPHRELSALEVGRLVHHVLELFYRRRVERAPTSMREVDFDTLRGELHEALEQACGELESRGAQGSPVLWEIRKRHLHEDLLRFLRHELQRGAARSSWVPSQFEFRFGPGRSRTLEIPRRDGPPLRFRGIVDRIDRHTQHDGLRVIDYKSGRPAPSGPTPQALQLVLYLLAAVSGEAARLERSEARFLYVTRRGDFGLQRISGARVRQRQEDFELLAREVSSGVATGAFFPQPGPNAMHCKPCDYRNVCDARVAWQVRRKSASGQDARYHALPDFGTDLVSAEEGETGRGDG
ncbi:MAG: exodeoxyribonuclease V subunit gamma [Candidatus Latescibacterota bacterium]|nr:MAG: exodeoxyribonuclease V subunit gamma [Candidatus Latescibacterota bacterium]